MTTSKPDGNRQPEGHAPGAGHFTTDILSVFSEYAILILDGGGKIIFANSGAEAMYGYERSELLGRSGREVLETPSLADMEKLEELLSRSDESGRFEFDLPQKRKNGEIFPARVRFQPSQERTDASVVVVSELEARGGVEQLKGDFLTLVSHELRTPLTSIKGAVSMLETWSRGKATPEQEEFLEIIERNCDRLNHLISSLLDMTRLEADRLRLQCASVNLDKLIREVGRFVGEQYSAKRILVTHAEYAEPIHIEADPIRLEQVFMGLLDNAFKFTPNGGRIQTAITATDGEVCVAVSDTGVGIAAEEQQRIFEKFYQVDSSLTRIAGGAGLGLYIARKLVKMHRGRIWVRSAPGEGSTFYVALPRSPRRGGG